jgi:uncharacterized membrane protein
VLVLALLATRMRREPLEEAPESERLASALRLGHRLFVPALLIPALTILVVLAGPHLVIGGTPLFAATGMTLVGLALACVISAMAAVVVTRQPPLRAADEGRRLLDTMGWAALLPLVLATLGGVFAASGVGESVASLVSMVIPADNRMACLLAFALGMVVFTVIMGNAFAAFPVMMAGIGLPLLVQRHGADPASLGAIGMLTGYCGTLLTPMAANFNIVPAVLLELDDQYGVIRAQAATGLWLMGTNVLLMAWLCFR